MKLRVANRRQRQFYEVSFARVYDTWQKKNGVAAQSLVALRRQARREARAKQGVLL